MRFHLEEYPKILLLRILNISGVEDSSIVHQDVKPAKILDCSRDQLVLRVGIFNVTDDHTGLETDAIFDRRNLQPRN